MGDDSDDEDDIPEIIEGMDDSEAFDTSLYNTASPNYFTNYLHPSSYLPFNQDNLKPKHIYTLSLHKPKFTQELFDLSTAYEAFVHHRLNIEPSFP